MINLNLTYEEAETLQDLLGGVLSEPSCMRKPTGTAHFHLVKVATRLAFNITEEWRAGTELIPLHIPVIISKDGEEEFEAVRTSLADSYHPKVQTVSFKLKDSLGKSTGVSTSVDLDTSKFSWRRL
ncbi:hypothetical protein HOU41_gp033 [Proteus phage Stubb]|uniref:Uncharacterized protein n=1 Tax=Proteus phage Stubb TaxID=2315597 RepID=A0A3B8DIZ6_9CAUD|nr:hypothetical protein HOU41_gp033 [Proteus phage Stubb]AYJ73173.1 hypothetical protein CPT_Stubb_033 [Proteus phage Stubb]